jgi:hypothetical protein
LLSGVAAKELTGVTKSVSLPITIFVGGEERFGPFLQFFVIEVGQVSQV